MRETLSGVSGVTSRCTWLVMNTQEWIATRHLREHSANQCA